MLSTKDTSCGSSRDCAATKAESMRLRRLPRAVFVRNARAAIGPSSASGSASLDSQWFRLTAKSLVAKSP